MPDYMSDSDIKQIDSEFGWSAKKNEKIPVKQNRYRIELSEEDIQEAKQNEIIDDVRKTLLCHFAVKFAPVQKGQYNPSVSIYYNDREAVMPLQNLLQMAEKHLRAAKNRIKANCEDIEVVLASDLPRSCKAMFYFLQESLDLLKKYSGQYERIKTINNHIYWWERAVNGAHILQLLNDDFEDNFSPLRVTSDLYGDFSWSKDYLLSMYLPRYLRDLTEVSTYNSWVQLYFSVIQYFELNRLGWRICKNCNTLFIPETRNRIYCSEKCELSAHHHVHESAAAVSKSLGAAIKRMEDTYGLAVCEAMPEYNELVELRQEFRYVFKCLRVAETEKKTDKLLDAWDQKLGEKFPKSKYIKWFVPKEKQKENAEELAKLTGRRTPRGNILTLSAILDATKNGTGEYVAYKELYDFGALRAAGKEQGNK